MEHNIYLRNKFIKGSATPHLTGGQPTINLNHNHGGIVGYTDDRQPDFQADAGTNYVTGNNHTHSMSSAWSSTENVIPPYADLQAYMRIK